MQKLSYHEYRLPIIEALGSFGLMDTGTTEPMSIRGVDMETGKRGHYVVKFRHANRMTIKSSCRELLGAWMAIELDINAVEPVLVNVSKEFVNTIIGQYGYQSALKSIGINFGSVYVDGLIQIPVTKFSWDDDLLTQAKMIFMFDMFIANADRGAGKPNVLYNGDSLMVFDHELAYSFVNMLPFLRNKTPWIFSNLEKEMYERHYFYSILRGIEHNFMQQVELLQRFDDDFWQKVMKWVPKDWQTEELKDIRSHLDMIIDNKNRFSEELTKILLV